MAYLLDLATQACFPLAPHHTFGRLANRVDTHVDRAYVSKLHAAVEWTGRHWQIKNMGRNGTWVNDRALELGESVKLATNDHIHLAESTEPGFRVIDLSPPVDMLWPLDTDVGSTPETQPIYLSRYHLLPDALTPELALYYEEEDRCWRLEASDHEQAPQTLDHGDRILFNNRQWQFVRAQIYGPTEARSNKVQRLSDIEFVFELSQDEETTHLQLQSAQQKIDLAVRTHHYLLLQLARHRAADAAEGLDPKNQGWVYSEQLAAELGLDTTHMNIQIFRARKQLTDSLPDILGHQFLLERSGGKIRFGCEKFRIYKGDALMTASPVTDQQMAAE